jgi:hypothetical protein
MIHLDMLKTIYSSFFDISSLQLDEHLIHLFEQEKFQEALEHCYTFDIEPLFRLIYLLTNVKFPIEFIISIQKEISENSGEVLSFGQSGEQLQKLNVPPSIFTKISTKVHMINFIIECRRFSKHQFYNGKFYYTFDQQRYSNRIKDLIYM